MKDLLKRFTRAGAFVAKEINEVRRQPRLVLSLIFGPFLILLLFGIGYQGESGHLTGIFVVPEKGGYSQKVEDYQKLVGDQLQVTRLTTDQAGALADLRNQLVDLVVVVPENIEEQIGAGSQARVPIYFNEVDPVRRSWLTYLTYVYIGEINKQTLAAAAGQGQENAGDIHAALVRMRNSLATVEDHLQRNEMDQAGQQAQGMQGESSNIQLGVLLLASLLSSNSPMIKPPDGQNAGPTNLAEGSNVSKRLAADVQALNDELSSSNPDRERARQRVTRVREDIDAMDSLTQQFQKINPLVLAAPFYPEAHNTAPLSPGFTSFYAPGVLVLLLQHIAITLAALSMVRERILGTVELFRVSPVKPGEIMAGKYISFTILLSLIAGVLLLMMSNELTIGGVRLSLGVPILGDYLLLAVTLLLVVFASVGLGFFISTISKSESQAVQLSMLVLLGSVFFSGFFLRLETIWPPIRSVSYSLPVTYGISSLQVIMLRGGTPAWWLLLGLAGLGVFFLLISYILFSRQFRRG
ncbi:MAG: ABC transporter permease [Chloroflexota bacterium]